jgi:tetratricopeptide (TPR) repeat protein
LKDCNQLECGPVIPNFFAPQKNYVRNYRRHSLFYSKLFLGLALQLVLAPLTIFSLTIQLANASDLDDISEKCGLAEIAQKAGKLDEAEKNLVDALQLSWKIPLANSKPVTDAEKAKIDGMSRDEKVSIANKEYADSVSDVVVMSIPMGLGQLCDSFEKAGRYDKVIEIHEWLVKNDLHRGGDDAQFDIASNRVMMAKAALQVKDNKKASAYYASALANESTMRRKMSPSQLQNFATVLKDYSQSLRTSGAFHEAAEVLQKSQEYMSSIVPDHPLERN